MVVVEIIMENCVFKTGMFNVSALLLCTMRRLGTRQ